MENRWAMEDAKGPRNEGLFYHESVLKSYQALRKAALNVDIINMEQSLDSYNLWLHQCYICFDLVSKQNCVLSLKMVGY